MWRLMFVLMIAACGGVPREPAHARPREVAAAAADDSLRFPKPARPISRIVAAQWTAEPVRDRTGEAGRVLDALAVGPGTRVADIGAGSGYYVRRAAERVGATGTVYAEDIVPAYLDALRARVADEALRGVRVIEGTPDDPRLSDRAVDVAILGHMYHEIENPYALLWHLRDALAPGARVGVIDMDAPTDRHGTPPALLRCEFAAVGFREVRRLDLAPADGYLAIFEAKDVRPAPHDIRACAAGVG